jgi:cell division septum initiation protein DivIVA
MDQVLTDTADPRDNIERLETRIEELEAKLESCQKFAAASRFAMALGGVLLLGLLSGVIPFDPLALTGAMAAGLGGIVTLGSNNSTAKEAAAQLAEAEAQRAALIGQIELRVIENPATLH